MKALSIMQPWAWLIVHGHKDIENRSWNTSYRGPVLIHCGKNFDGPRDEWDWPDIQPPGRFDQGGIVGQAEIVDCVTASRSRWFEGAYGFVIRNARPLPFQPCRGQLGFFVPDYPAAVPQGDLLQAHPASHPARGQDGEGGGRG